MSTLAGEINNQINAGRKSIERSVGDMKDIEMPNLDGLGLTERIRHDPRFASLPVLAVTSVCGEGAEKRGLAAGVDEYLIKLDQEKLLVSIAHYMTCGRAA